MTLRITVVVGNPKPQSRTMAVAHKLAETLFSTSDSRIEVIDLADYSAEIFAWPSDRMKELSEKVATSDVVFFASPTYKASYTGLLKAFLDRYGTNGLAGIVAIPVMTGGDKTHSMAPDVNLAPLLMELGAVIPGRGLYFVIDQMEQIDDVVSAAADVYAGNLARVAKVAARVERR